MQHSPETQQLNLGMSGDAPLVRCAACQLQLCKARGEPPHAALNELSRDEREGSVRYSCQKCGAVLVRSTDYARPGWAHRR